MAGGQSPYTPTRGRRGQQQKNLTTNAAGSRNRISGIGYRHLLLAFSLMWCRVDE